jgi:hypothetical protein
MGNVERARLSVQGSVFVTIRVMVWYALRSQDIGAQYVPVDGKNLEDLVETNFVPILSVDL